MIPFYPHTINRAQIVSILLIILALAFIQFAHADTVWSGCDNTTSFSPTNGNITPNIACTNEGGTAPSGAATLYAAQFNVSVPNTGDLYYQTSDATNNGCYQVTSPPTSTGEQTIVLSTPLNFNAGAFKYVNFYSDSVCSINTGVFQVPYSGSQPYGFNRVLYWAPYTGLGACLDGTIGDCIDSVTPANGDTVASSTGVSLETTGWESELNASIHWNLYSSAQSLHNCTDVACAFDSSNTGYNYTEPVGSVGVLFDISTTTQVLPAGLYKMTTEIIVPKTYFGLDGIFGYNFGNNTLVSTTTSFVIGTTTSTDRLIQAVGAGSVSSAVAAINATSTDAYLTSCDLLTFNLDNCLFALFYPEQGTFSAMVSQETNEFITRAPWGYATRMISILTDTASSTATSTLPTFTAAFASDSPMYGHDLTFNMQDMVTGGSNLVSNIPDPISGLTLRQIIEPWIQLFIALSAIIIIFHDIMGMGNHSIRSKK